MAYLNRDEYPLWPKWMPVCIRKHLPFQREFKWAAYAHDDLYEIGWSERKRWKADLIFYRLMVSKVNELPMSRSLAWYTLAYAYYVGVRIGWPLSFNYKYGYR